MALNLEGFVTPEQEFEGLSRAANTLERRNIRDAELKQQQEGKKAASTKFIADYLDPKQRLTGSPYDPEIVTGLNNILTEASDLIGKGAPLSDVMIAMGPKIGKINEYSTKAKLIQNNIKQSADRLKGYGGYNLAALEDQAKKMAFYNADGTMRDISTVDPSADWVTQATAEYPELVTTSAGIDEIVKKLPLRNISETIQTSHLGQNKMAKYKATLPFYESLQRGDDGEVALDAAGNPVGLEVKGETLYGDDKKPILNPTTNRPFRALPKADYDAIMSSDPSTADFIRGQIKKYFKDAGVEKMPVEGSPQWHMMGRVILRDELQTRSRSSFETIDQEKASALGTKLQIARDPEELNLLRKVSEATRKQTSGEGSERVTKNITYPQVLSNIWNNDPDYKGSIETVDGKEVEDVTSLLPDLKYSNDQVFKKVYRDPSNNTITFVKQDGTKDVVSEAGAAKFAKSLSGYNNNLNPDFIRKSFEDAGYQEGKFKKAQPGDVQQRAKAASEERKVTQLKKLDDFRGSGNVSELDDLKGVKTPDGTIAKIAKTSSLNLLNDYYIKFADGKEKKFKNKEELANYLKKEEGKSAPAQQTTGGSSDWKSRAKKLN